MAALFEIAKQNKPENSLDIHHKNYVNYGMFIQWFDIGQMHFRRKKYVKEENQIQNTYSMR